MMTFGRILFIIVKVSVIIAVIFIISNIGLWAFGHISLCDEVVDDGVWECQLLLFFSPKWLKCSVTEMPSMSTACFRDVWGRNMRPFPNCNLEVCPSCMLFQAFAARRDGRQINVGFWADCFIPTFFFQHIVTKIIYIGEARSSVHCTCEGFNIVIRRNVSMFHDSQSFASLSMKCGCCCSAVRAFNFPLPLNALTVSHPV